MERRMVRIWRAGDQLPAPALEPLRQYLGTQEGRLTLQHVETDAAQLVDVGVVDFGQESHLGWRHGVVVGEE